MNTTTLELSQKKPIGYLIALTALAITALDSGLIVQNYITQFGILTISAAVFIYPLLCIALDMTCEIYEYRIAQYVLWGTLASNLLMGILTNAALLLPYPHFWAHFITSYDAANGHNFRIALSGSLSILLGQYLNIYLFSRLKRAMRGKYFALRSMLTTFLGDGLTVVVALFAFYLNRMTLAEIGKVIVSELVVMYSLSIILGLIGGKLINFFKQQARVGKRS